LHEEDVNQPFAIEDMLIELPAMLITKQLDFESVYRNRLYVLMMIDQLLCK
jgi:hypothetical protein